MRVLHISPSFAPAYRYGGPVHSLLGLTKSLIRQGVEVRVLTTDCDGPKRLDVTKAWTEFEGVPTRYVHSWSDRDFAPALLATPRTELAWADVIHVTGLFCSTSMWGIAAARLVRKPVVLSLHGVLDDGSLGRKSLKKEIWLRSFASLIQSVTAFHTSSTSETEALLRTLGSVRVVQVANGVNVADYAPVNTTRRMPRVVALGRIHPIKGYLELVRALGVLRDRGVHADLDIVGPREDARFAASLEQEASSLGLSERFQLLPPLHGAQKARFLAEGTVLALPSLTENFGIVVLEALASGIPVVASKQTPWSMLETEDCGRWVERTPESLADALQPYLTDPLVGPRQGLAGRLLVEKQFSWSIIAAEMATHYEALAIDHL